MVCQSGEELAVNKTGYPIAVQVAHSSATSMVLINNQVFILVFGFEKTIDSF